MVMQRLMTVAEFLALPEAKPRLEFLHGQAVPKPMTNSEHMRLVARLAARFDAYCEQTGGVAGPEGSVLLEGSEGEDKMVFLPDMAYWAPGRPFGLYPLTPPTLAVEVRSPGQTLASMRAKCAEYLARGVDLTWLVDPASRTVEVRDVDGGAHTYRVGGILTSAYLPAFALAVDDLFAVLR
jgi:Uma2 family endonuclease